ncbi:uncharacterized protein LOC119287969 [Triticum dicoccoides]|uniref:uncharacterized protein LOC119287969 n=1 Tax=Triticum dicoccoides TaxID=85692 RepID=UPI00188EE2A3|nr:uncharacterized protein LOC119287969 [Triticum dicoccoides]XP_037423479.1 uncharacterized protein LOC119287969 [Triticum dicoccoides]XP_037423480.1 uncharacterized protein LOC119287969 [Triticum dicoccoides]XP_037423481.1 uncharacterized protein LOC119287969 [Triticum dicoccoides]
MVMERRLGKGAATRGTRRWEFAGRRRPRQACQHPQFLTTQEWPCAPEVRLSSSSAHPGERHPRKLRHRHASPVPRVMFHLVFLPTAAQKGTNASSASTGEREDDADGPADLHFFLPALLSVWSQAVCYRSTASSASVQRQFPTWSRRWTSPRPAVFQRRANSKLLQCCAPPFPTNSQLLLCPSSGKQQASNSQAAARQLVVTSLTAVITLRFVGRTWIWRSQLLAVCARNS